MGERRRGIDKGASTKGANINAILQTADVAPITNLILPSQPVLSYSPVSTNRGKRKGDRETEKERERRQRQRGRGDICRIQTYHIPLPFPRSSPSPDSIFSLSPFHPQTMT